MPTLQDIQSFGGTAAEDDDIARFFVRTPEFETIWSGQANVVIGRKGAGKTALFLALAERAKEERRLAAGLSFSAYPWDAHHQYALQDSTSSERFVESWTFLFLVEAFDLISRDSGVGLSRSSSRAVGEVRRFLRENYGDKRLDFRQAFPEGGLSLATVDLEAGARGAKGRVGFKKGASPTLGRTLKRLNEWMMARLKALGSECPATYILLDELDLGFDPGDDDYVDRIVGLLIAARRFSAAAKASSAQVFPVVFLRADIFDRLHFGDKNKIRNANTIELRWHDRLEHAGSSLKHLIDWRIKESLGLESASGAWERAFDERLTRGTQHKFQHITYRTFLRPRDAIKFCNLALEQYKIRTAGMQRPGLISNDDLKAARPDYSEYFRLELDDEIAEAVPEWESYLEVLKSIGAATFAMRDFERGYAATQRKGVVSAPKEDVLPLLYEYSIIGFEKTRPSGSGFAHHFRYQGESVRFDPDASSFLVHRGLKETLDIRETNSV